MTGDYLIRLWQDPDDPHGYWTIEVLNRPGCLSQGKTREEALAGIGEALALYEESADPPSEIECTTVAAPSVEVIWPACRRATDGL